MEREVRAARVLPERLVPAGATRDADNAPIATALKAFSERTSRDDWRALEDFARTNPTSPWRPSVLANLATLHVRSGAYSRAQALYLQVWEQTRGLKAPQQRALADYALGEWLEHAIKFGQVAAVKARLLELGDREVSGTAAAKVRHAREGVWFLENVHHKATFSGPEALRNLIRTLNGDETPEPESLRRYAPTPAGTSAVDLVALGKATDLPLRPLMRTSAKSAIPVPSIVHLRVDHYSTVVAFDQGGYVVRDPVLGGKVWIRAGILEDEASGLVLVPVTKDSAIAGAWRDATDVEQGQAIGHCAPGMPGDDPCPCNAAGGGGGGGGDGGGGGGNGPSPGMPTYQFHPVKAAVLITDTPVGYTPPRGPSVSFTLRYDQRDQRQPQVAEYGDIGPRWTFDWLSYVHDNYTSAQAPYQWTRVYLRGQSEEWYGGQDLLPYHWRSRATLVKVANDPVRYERRLPDGTVEVFELPDRGPGEYGRRIFLSQVIDPRGQTLTFTYDSQLRLVAVTDAIGQVTTLSYALVTDPLKVTAVTDPFGRSATLEYDGNGRLASVTDVIGLKSSFTYGPEDFIATMTTPYGTTSFRHEPNQVGSGVRWVEATDPLGGTERLEFRWESVENPETLPTSEVPAGFADLNYQMDDYNTFYWGPRAMAIAPGQASSAVITSWLVGPNMAYSFNFSRNIPHSVKRPLESRVWFRYPGQSSPAGRWVGVGTVPIEQARILEGGATQSWQQSLNAQGKVTSTTDAVGRRTNYVYASNGIDLLEVRQTTGALNDLVTAYGSYTAGHQPQTTTDAAGYSTTRTYSAAGQLLTRTSAENETTTYTYNASGQLMTVTGPVAGATTTYTYDAYNRVSTVTDNDGFTVTADYDLFDRPIRLTYPDGTYDEAVYDRLDVVRARDRLGRWTYRTFDADRRLTATRDAAGRTTRQEWCGCGGLDASIDPKGQRTSWQRDIQGRVTAEVRADGTTTTTFTYDLVGRLATVTDPKGQVTTYTYAADNATLGVAYSNAQTATPSVTYTYDTAFPRLATMTDGIGTTSYSYHPVGGVGALQLATVDGPLTDDTIAYGYDQLGRQVQRTVNGSANTSTISYDALGRVTAETNVLGAFTFGYEGVTSRLSTVAYPNGQTSTFSYLQDPHDRRLQTVHHRNSSGATLSRFDYTYDAVGNIKTWQQQADSSPPVVWEYAYDQVDQLTRAVKYSPGAPPAPLARFAWGYDQAGNRLYEQIDDSVTGWTYDNLNRLLTQYAGGALRFAGTLNEPATVMVNGQAAPVSPTGQFAREVPVAAGANVVTIAATDAAGNTATASYQVSIGSAAKTFAFDANGNMTGDGTRSWEWDARNQIVAVQVGNQRAEFSYDGLKRRVGEVTKVAGTVINDKRLVWCDLSPCEEREPSGPVSRQLTSWGQRSAGQNQFYTADHLGSRRELTDGLGAVVHREPYDPWGRPESPGLTAGDGGFTGHRYQSLDSGWYTLLRAYVPDLGRWLSEDPAGTGASPNLYTYVRNAPNNLVDFLGDRAGCTSCECNVAVKCRPVGGRIGAVAQHCYFWLTNADCSNTTVEAGPTGSGNPDWGQNRGNVIPGNKPPNDPQGDADLYVITNGDRCEINACIKRTVKVWNDKNVRYSPFPGPNSNSFVRWIIVMCGVHDPDGPPPTAHGYYYFGY